MPKNSQQDNLEFERERFKIETALKEQELENQKFHNQELLKAEKEKLQYERSRKFWESTLPRMATFISAIAAAAAVVLTYNQNERDRIATEAARVEETKAQREADVEDREQRLKELQLERETQLILQATRDVDIERAQANIRFLAQLEYLSKSADDFDKLFSRGFSLQTSSGQTSPDREERLEAVFHFGDWSVFDDQEQNSCFMASLPVRSVAKRGDDVVAVRRGEISLYITRAPEAEIEFQVSYKSGYPFGNIPVRVNTELGTLTMFTDDEYAWPATNEEDSKFLNAFEKSKEVTIIGASSRGTTTEDTFSMEGFVKAKKLLEIIC